MRRIALVSTGGTIAGGRGPDGAISPALSGNDFQAWAHTGDDVDFVVREVLSTDSASMTFADLDIVAFAVRDALADTATDAVIVLHGTDAMEETAMLVDLQHDDPRPVLFVGAQRPADHADSDGPHNLRAAIELALDPASRGRGALIVIGGTALPARGTRKIHTTDLQAFATVDPPIPRRIMPPRGVADVRVDVVALYPGADTVALDAVVGAGARGVILEAMGSGNANAGIVAAVRRLAAHIAVVVSTRVDSGPVTPAYGGGGGGYDLVAAGAVISPALRPGQARILLAALLAGDADRDDITDWFASQVPTDDNYR